MKTTKMKEGDEKGKWTKEARMQQCKLFIALITKTRNKEHRKMEYARLT